MTTPTPTLGQLLYQALSDPDLPHSLHIATMCHCAQHADEAGDPMVSQPGDDEPIGPEHFGEECSDHWQLWDDISGYEPTFGTIASGTYPTAANLRAVARLVTAAGAVKASGPIATGGTR